MRKGSEILENVLQLRRQYRAIADQLVRPRGGGLIHASRQRKDRATGAAPAALIIR